MRATRSSAAATAASTAGSSSPSPRPGSTADRAVRRCRPSASNVRFFPTAAAAQRAGFRACLRCRPDAAPGSPDWDRARRPRRPRDALIADGVVDREGVPGLARRLGYTRAAAAPPAARRVRRRPLALARAQRAQTARMLIETTRLGFVEVAFAAGFSQRPPVQRDDPRDPRENAKRAAQGAAAKKRGAERPGQPQGATRLPRAAGWRRSSGHFLAAPRRSRRRGGRRRRLPAHAAASHAAGVSSSSARSSATSSAGFAAATCGDLALPSNAAAGCSTSTPTRSRSMRTLAARSAAGPARLRVPGRRVPGTVDGAELALRAVLGQQVSVAAASTTAGKLTLALGEALPKPDRSLTHLFPSAEAVAGRGPTVLFGPHRRRGPCGPGSRLGWQ